MGAASRNLVTETETPWPDSTRGRVFEQTVIGLVLLMIRAPERSSTIAWTESPWMMATLKPRARSAAYPVSPAEEDMPCRSARDRRLKPGGPAFPPSAPR